MLRDAARSRARRDRLGERRHRALEREHAHVVARDVRHEQVAAVSRQRDRALRRQMRLTVPGPAGRERPSVGEHACGIAPVRDHLVVRGVRLHEHRARHGGLHGVSFLHQPGRGSVPLRHRCVTRSERGSTPLQGGSSESSPSRTGRAHTRPVRLDPRMPLTPRLRPPPGSSPRRPSSGRTRRQG